MLVVVMLATPAMAASIPAVADWLYQVSPEMAERFTPVQESCTKNGIKMEVVSASIHGATAEICISFTDMTGNRLSRNSMPELFETRFLGKVANMSGTWGGGISEMEYDEETNTLNLVMERNFSFYSEDEQRYLDVAELFGSKLTVSTEMLYEYIDQPVVEVPIEITDSEVLSFNLREDRRELGIDNFGYNSNAPFETWAEQEDFQIIAPGNGGYQVTDKIAVTGMTWIDGKLHIQTCTPGDRTTLPEYDLWLEDAEGNVVEESENMRLFMRDNRYEENIFHISETELENYRLMCQVSEKNTIKGPWKVTFAFTESDYVGEHDDGIPMETAIG